MTQLTKMRIRAMKIVLTLQQGSFPNGNNVKTIYAASLPGFLHAEANIQRMPAWLGNTAVVVIYGMTDYDCFQATKYNITIDRSYYNQVQVYAGYLENISANNDGSYTQGIVTAAIDKLPIVFLGQVASAGADFNDPNRPFIIQAVVTTQALSVINQPTSVSIPTNLSTIIQGMITTQNNTNPQITYNLSSVSPDTVVNNAHYSGSFSSKLQQICSDYGYQFRIIMTSTNIQNIEVTKIGTSLGSNATTLSSSTGMIGYPTVLPFGIAVREFFDPNRSINDRINLETFYTPLAQTYYVWQMASILQTNGDAWESNLTLYSFNNSAYGTTG